ncbi:MAG: TIGR00289 family protein [Candidatus Verstraetearchaeota archaeon]|nr:TIGR00289 family protein [Candidatus Verstraetearchaeota archaeon]
MKALALFSGGKDSTLAVYEAVQRGVEIVGLLSIIPEAEDSWMFHVPNMEWTHLQAEAMELPFYRFQVKGHKEEEVEELKEILRRLKREVEFEGVVSGAIDSVYQKSRIDAVCRRLCLKSISPLWRRDAKELLKKVLSEGFEVYIVGVFAEGFDKSWLGRKVCEELVEKLVKLREKYGIHLCGEGGEYETFVCDCPLFKRKIVITEAEKLWRRNWGVLRVRKAALIKKG